MNELELRKAYNGKTVYITGITGFKGSWLALMLSYLGAKVHGFGLETDTDDWLFHSAKVDEIASVTIGDINAPLDSNPLLELCVQQPDYIFHLAAQPIVSVGYKSPYLTFLTNIMGTVKLHEVIRGIASKKRLSVINVTTDKVYEDLSDRAYETDKLNGFDPYSLSKSCSDMITQCYERSFEYENTVFSTCRAGNVIGGGDFAENRLVPDAVRAASNKTVLHVRNPKSVRPYQHVFDALNGYLIIAAQQYEGLITPGAFNVGPTSNEAMQTSELLNKLSHQLSFTWQADGKSVGHEAPCLQLDVSKLLTVTDWRPVFDTSDKIIKATADWYNKFIEGKQMQAITLCQIKEAYNAN